MTPLMNIDVDAVAADLGRRGASRTAAIGLAGVIENLAAEAAIEAAAAEAVELREYQLGVEGQEMRSPMRFGTSGGAVLAAIHEHDDLRELASGLAGRPMTPSKSAYLYFEEDDDRIGLHMDLPACELTLVVGIAGDAPPLVAYPELQGTPPQELLRLAQQSDGAPPGGTPFELAPGEVVALVGGRVPHQTPPAHRREAGIVASLCYVGSGPAL
jgi:hypothetical protein